MPVTTVPADQVIYVDGRPKLLSVSDKPKSNVASFANIRNKQKRRAPKYKCRAEQLTPRLELVTPGSPVAVDCEGMYLPGTPGIQSRGVGRISIVNTDLEVVYDTFVYYPPDVEHRPDPQWLGFGVKYKDILAVNGAQPHASVLAAAKSIFDKSGIVVGHSLHSDMNMLRGIDFSGYTKHDTQRVSEYRKYASGRGGIPALAVLAANILGEEIQVEEHNSIEDARATMELWLLHVNGPITNAAE